MTARTAIRSSKLDAFVACLCAVATAYAALFAATLVYIGHENDVQPNGGASSSAIGNEVRRTASSLPSPAQGLWTSTTGTASPVSSIKAGDKADLKSDIWTIPDIDALPDNAWGRIVRQGRDLTVATYAYLGLEATNPAKRYAGSNMSCRSCHLEAGTKKFGLPFVGVFADFPQYRSRWPSLPAFRAWDSFTSIFEAEPCKPSTLAR